MTEDLPDVFRSGLQFLGLEGCTEAFLRYRQELLEWNTRFNLTAIKDPEEVLVKHFLDSLTLLQVYDRPHIQLLDMGTGPGFPGLPLKIARPDWHVTLVEATGKKVTFLQHIVTELQLEHVEVVHARVEDLAQKPIYRGRFDLVTARAMSALATLLECGAPFCRVGGEIILPKKGEMTEEMAAGKRAAGQLGARLKKDVAVELPGLAEDGRRLLVWEQIKKCPAHFPRSWAAMTKKPL